MTADVGAVSDAFSALADVSVATTTRVDGFSSTTATATAVVG